MRAIKATIATILILLAIPATAGVPDFITYSGRITDGSYDGLSAQATITFRLFDAAEGGTLLWEHEEAVVVQDGYFSVMLGEGAVGNQIKNITTVFAEHGETWMELEVGGQALAERRRVGSVPYAGRANHCERVEVAHGDKRYSLNAVYGGSTRDIDWPEGGSFNAGGATQGRIELPEEYGGQAGGNAAKKACQFVLGSQTAHMCTPREMLVSYRVGLFAGIIDTFWVDGQSYQASYDPDVNKVRRCYSCFNWASNVSDYSWGESMGGTWQLESSQSESGPRWNRCSEYHPVACCDFKEEMQ